MDLNRVVEILSTDPTFLKKWKSFARKLRITSVQFSQLEKLEAQNEPTDEILMKILEYWESLQGTNANYLVLCRHLRDSEFNKIAELLENDDQLPSTSTSASVRPIEPTESSLDEILPPVDNFCGRADELNELKAAIHDKQFPFIVVSGSGGVGKTELSRKLISLYNNSETVVCSWLAGDTDMSLNSSLQRLASQYNFKFDGNAESVTSEIGKYITAKTSTWLLIIDNVDEMNDSVKRVLKIINISFKKKAIVLITSRNVSLLSRTGHKNVKLIELKDDEAKRLIMQSLGIETENKYVTELCKTLQNYPLALQQAVAYIKERKDSSTKGEAYGIPDYLEEYKITKQKLLDFPLCDITFDYKYTVYTTWNIAINRLQKLNPTAIKLMNVVAYLYPDKIKVTYLGKILVNMDLEENEVEKGMELCKKYSLVKIEDSSLSVHRLVQEVIKLQLCASNLEFSFLESLINAMSASTFFILSRQALRDRQKTFKKERMREFMRIWEFSMKKHANIIQNVKTVPCQIASTMIKTKFTVEYPTFYKKSLKSLRKGLGMSDIEVWKMEVVTVLSKLLGYGPKMGECKQILTCLGKVLALDPADEQISNLILDLAFDEDEFTFILTPDKEDLKTIENVAAHLSNTLGENHSHTIKVQFILGVSLKKNKEHLRAIPLLKKYCAWTSMHFDISKYKRGSNNPSSSQIHYEQAHTNCGISLQKYYSSLTSKSNKMGGCNSFVEEDGTLIDPLCSLQQIEEAVSIWEKELQLGRLPYYQHDLFLERLKLVHKPDKIVEYTKNSLQNILNQPEPHNGMDKLYHRIKLAEALEMSSKLPDFNQQVMEIIEDAKPDKDTGNYIFYMILKFADGLLERSKCNEAHLIYHALLTLLDNPKGINIRKETIVQFQEELKSKISKAIEMFQRDTSL